MKRVDRLLVPFDSTFVAAYHIQSDWRTIDPAHQFSLGFSIHQLSKVNEGEFQAVILKADSTELRQNFGMIHGNSTEAKTHVINIKSNSLSIK
jgi:hypothetical protein